MINFDRIAEAYDATRALPADEMRVLLDSLHATINHYREILDVGVGTGRFAAPLQDMGFEVYGVDISDKMMKEARKKGLRHLIKGDVSNLPFRAKTFDAAVIVHVLHLVQDPSKVLEEVARVTRHTIVSPVERVDGPRFRLFYAQLLEKAGHSTVHFELGEEALSRIIPPAEMIHVLERERKINVEEELAFFERRLSSITWDVPDDVHSRIIAEMRSKFGEPSISQKSSLEIAVWRPGQLKATPEKLGQRRRRRRGGGGGGDRSDPQ